MPLPLRDARAHVPSTGFRTLRGGPRKSVRPDAKNPLNATANMHTSRLAQFRTCLWLRADRWDFGQEAEVTPRAERPQEFGSDPEKVGSRKANR